MSIFDKLKQNKQNTANNISAGMPDPRFPVTKTFTFQALPESLEEMKALSEARLSNPYETAALTVCALCVYAADKGIGTQMLNFLRGPRPLSNYDISFLNDRFRDGHQVPFSYFEGAVPANDYTPDIPFTIKVEAGPYSSANADQGYKKLFIRSGGADNPREVVLRQAGNGQWYLWDQFLMVSIRKGKSDDPWA